MIDFLPQEARAAVRREYHLRLLAVALFFFSVIALAGAALLSPTYLLLVHRLGALAVADAPIGTAESAAKYEQARETLEYTEALTTQLASAPSATILAGTLEEIQKIQPESISVARILYERQANAALLTVDGTAATREVLLWFAEALRRVPLFKEVNLPLASLAAERNLPFALTIILAEVRTP